MEHQYLSPNWPGELDDVEISTFSEDFNSIGNNISNFDTMPSFGFDKQGQSRNQLQAPSSFLDWTMPADGAQLMGYQTSQV